MTDTKHNILAKPCYSHIGGRLGALLMEQYIKKGWIKKEADADKYYYVTAKGMKAFSELGIDLSQIPMEDVK